MQSVCVVAFICHDLLESTHDANVTLAYTRSLGWFQRLASTQIPFNIDEGI